MEKERIKLQVVSLAVILLLSISLILAIIPFTASVSASTATTSIEVEKWVKYKGEPDTEYRKTIDDAKVCDIVTFKIAIQNDGSTPLTYIWILDSILDCYLEYIEGSARPIQPTLYDNWCPEYQEFWWEFPDLWLEPGEYFNITFDAHVVKSGNDINEVYVYAEDDATGEWDEDEDTVEVNIPAVPAECVETATGSGIACFNTNAGTMDDLKAVAESTLPSEGKPDLAFIHGLFSFNITALTANQTVEVTITLPINVPVGTQYWGYGPTPDNQTPHWYQIPMGSGDGDDVITIIITDGYKIGDNDLSANGEIAALGGPGVSQPPDLWTEINNELENLLNKVSAADMPNIIKQRVIDKLEFAKALKDNAKEEYEAGNIDGATKKLGVAKNQVESFASMVKITRRISSEDKASFLADATEIIEKIDKLIEYIETVP